MVRTKREKKTVQQLLCQFVCYITIIANITDMLKSGYFTTRTELLEWINSTLQLQLTKIQQLGAGNVYCHLLDAAFPSKVPLHKVKWHAYLEIDFIYNFKILQNCFQHLGINRHIEVQKLVKAKYQDNLEFIQWMKFEFSEQIKNNRSYDPLKRRNYASICLSFADRLEKNAQNKSTGSLVGCLMNKENNNQQNTAQTPRLSLQTQRNSLRSIGQEINKTHHDQNSIRKKRNSITIQSNTDQALLERPRLGRSNNRVHTQSGHSIVNRRLYTDFILQTEEEDAF